MSWPPAPKTLLTAAWAAPMGGASLIREAGVVHAGGRVLALGDAKKLHREHPDAAVEQLGDVLLMPGLVNAHCHLELTFAARPAAPITFSQWVLKLLEQFQRDDLLDPTRGDTGTATADCLRFGVTCVGDITATPAGTRAVIDLQKRRPRVVSYGEVRAMASRRDRLGPMLMAATERPMSPLTRIGVSPHAPYSVEPEGFRECLAVARRLSLPLATHLAETPDEAAFLASHTGPLRDLWDAIGGWDDAVPRFEDGPIRYAKELGLLDYDRTSLAHVNYCDDDELAILAAGRASVVYCPRTHAYFGHRPHRWREMLARGINVAVGTDSTASSPDLNLVDDLRLLHRIAPEMPAADLWEMATSRAARALGMHAEVGALAVGMAADFAVFPVRGSEPLEEILEDPARRPVRTWVAGSPAAEATAPT